MSKKINKAHLMTGYSPHRIENDVYNTPPIAIRSLLDREKFNSDIIWECACGKGNISKELEDYYGIYSKDIVSSDLRNDDEIYGIKGINFLEWNNLSLLSGNNYYNTFDIVTNPPFSYALEFILHAKELGVNKMAMLLKLDFLGSISRYKKLWCDTEVPLTKLYVFVKRLDFGLKSKPTLCHAWYIFERGSNTNKPVIELIPNHLY